MKKIIEINYKDTVLLDEKEMESAAEKVLPYVSLLEKTAGGGAYTSPESSLSLPRDMALLEQVNVLSREYGAPDLKYIIVVGIGGSSLGTQAVYEAAFLKPCLLRSKGPVLYTVEANNPREMENLRLFIKENVEKAKHIVINIVTKSGTTTETMANAAFLLEAMMHKFTEAASLERLVITTDENSVLHEVAREKHIKALTVPKMVGGRYSVFSPVSLFPLALAGINIKELVSGAAEAEEQCFSLHLEENPALLGAVITYLSEKKKQNIYNSFYFHPELESLGKWWRQLTAESLGKKTDAEGKTINAGITPIVSIGSADLHSMFQLYLGGPKDKITNFVYAEAGQRGRVVVPTNSPLKNASPDIFGKDFYDITHAILAGTLAAYKNEKIPYMETILPDLGEFSLGAYMQIKMIETMLLAKMWNINAFDQPEVESYKNITRGLLKR